jgi:hypothetical protein
LMRSMFDVFWQDFTGGRHIVPFVVFDVQCFYQSAHQRLQIGAILVLSILLHYWNTSV